MTVALVLLAAVLGLALGFLAGSRRARGTAAAAPSQPLSALEAGIANFINLLNNRLSAIGGFAGLVDRGPLTARDREALDSIAAEARAAAEIARDLVYLVQPPGQTSGAAHLPSVLSAVLDGQRLELLEAGVEVGVDVDPGVSVVAAPRADLENLFRRLLRFALVRVVRGAEPRRVSWTARPIGASVIVTQLDSGPPLPTDASHDLNYFRPADPTFLGHVELALAQRVAERCRAALRVEPAASEGNGAEATVTLIPSRLLEPPRRTPTGGTPAQPGRVLVADDDDANRRALAQLLQSQGHDVVTAADGVEALERLAADHCDAVVVDLQMPRLGGRAVDEEVQRREPGLARRFVFVTGDDVRAASHQFLTQVPQPTVRKPYEIAELLAAVDSVAGPS